ncbi:uncharacterized protein LOC109601842 [Aethina tumida]|uniref:uncharacterized protein LOC109601842 n=1 Tax=Aethina tumida TaxID=116153 RepID=UPI002149443D|nr:uncharacterized protein LOC109601842 [Aethina tumida]
MKTLRYLALTCLIVCAVLTTTEGKTTTKNHALLTKLGLQKIRGPNSHHRKRLAVESRHHSRSDDSHMFIIKLPPNPHYYTHALPNVNSIDAQSKSIPVGFKSNGRPDKVYHWNLPVMKKMANKHKRRFSNPNTLENWNEVLDKGDRERKPQKPSYYIPAKPKKSNVMKYFSGNGKPHSFYVIEKSKKAHYHRLLP